MQKGTLLVVDDEVHIVKITELALKDKIENILTANNGKEALDIVTSQEVHCILSDIKMPIMDGIQFIKEVRGRGNKVPFIFYTGFGSDQLMLEALKYGAFDFIDKPEMENLEETVLRGLKAGYENFTEEDKKNIDDDEHVSNYRKMLKND